MSKVLLRTHSTVPPPLPHQQAQTALLTHPATVLGYGTQTAAVSKAALSGNTRKALGLSLLAPTAMHLQHSHFLLPLRSLVMFQMGNFLVGLMWAAGMPCWLNPERSMLAASSPPAAAAAGSTTTAANITCSHLFGANLMSLRGGGGGGNSTSGTCRMPEQAAAVAAHALQRAATEVCSKVHMLHVLLSLPLPAAPPMLAAAVTHPLCMSASAFQVLYLFIAAFLLLVLPLTCCYCLEWWGKSRWLQARGITIAADRSKFWGFLPLLHVDEEPETDGGTTTVSQRWWWCPAPLLLLLLVLQLPWALAEMLTTHLGGACAPPLGASAFDWMAGVW